MKCQVQQGFMVLRPCGERAIFQCPTCQRAVCVAHGIGGTCSECAPDAGDWRLDPQGPSRYRRRFYNNTGWVDDANLYWGWERHGFDERASLEDSEGPDSSWDS